MFKTSLTPLDAWSRVMGTRVYEHGLMPYDISFPPQYHNIGDLLHDGEFTPEIHDNHIDSALHVTPVLFPRLSHPKWVLRVELLHGRLPTIRNMQAWTVLWRRLVAWRDGIAAGTINQTMTTYLNIENAFDMTVVASVMKLAHPTTWQEGEGKGGAIQPADAEETMDSQGFEAGERNGTAASKKDGKQRAWSPDPWRRDQVPRSLRDQREAEGSTKNGQSSGSWRY